uniref:pyruvate synthase n=1 Tax=Fervidicoccus fontis TaxID=683846 RepID=A0A7J3ZKL4_9CREN
MEELVLVEGIWLGRGGQGIVLASYILAEAAIIEGKVAMAMPEFGAERRGAPVRAYNRILAPGRTKGIGILPRTPVEQADFLVVMEPHLLASRSLFPKLKENATVLVSTERRPEEVCKMLEIVDKSSPRVYTVDAIKVAVETIGRPIVNTTLLGALVRVREGLVDKSSLERALANRLSGEILERNVEALRRGYEEVIGP